MQVTAVCLFCHKNKVPIEQWNKRCPECKELQRKKDEDEQKTILIGERKPAAVLEVGQQKSEVWVDKLGNEVKNPGYDLKHDPHGWKYTGKDRSERTMIL